MPTEISIRGQQNEELDVVSAEYEDSFSLEPFETLIGMHFRANRGFILGRVLTWDSKQPGKEFYSYYNAYHLNKILFQTQVYSNKKLIHRLNVLNPLTNTDIIGDVVYFLIEQDPSEAAGLKIVVDSANMPFSPTKERNQEILRRTSAIMSKALPPRLSISKDAPLSPLSDPEPSSQMFGNTSISVPSPTITYSKDDLFLKTVYVGPERKSSFQASGPKKKPKPSKRDEETAVATNPSKKDEGMAVAMKPVSPNNGIATRFHLPVPQEDSEEMEVNTKRRLSARNSLIPNETLPPKRPSLRPVREEQEESQDAGATTTSPHRFVARYLGTDTDYLEKSKFRAIFKAHALNVEDTFLFEMPEFLPSSSTAITQMEMIDAWYAGNPDDSCIAELCSLKPAGFGQMGAPRRFFHIVKCYLLAILILGCMLFLILWTLFGVGTYKSNAPQ